MLALAVMLGGLGVVCVVLGYKEQSFEEWRADFWTRMIRDDAKK